MTNWLEGFVDCSQSITTMHEASRAEMTSGQDGITDLSSLDWKMRIIG